MLISLEGAEVKTMRAQIQIVEAVEAHAELKTAVKMIQALIRKTVDPMEMKT